MSENYEQFHYGFIYASSKGFGSTYHVRADRVMYDWMVEPIEDSLFVNREIMIDLPDGYFFLDGQLYTSKSYASLEKVNSKKVQKKVVVYQEAPVFSKALVIIAGRLGVSKGLFDGFALPPERIFHIQNPHG